MCYKNEMHERLEQTLSQNLKDIPKFISSYFSTIRSSKTKRNNWGIIKDMLLYFIDTGLFQKGSLSELTPEDIQSITYTDIINFLGKDKTLKDSTILSKKAVLSSFWTHLKLIGVVEENIVSNIPRGTFKNEEQNKVVKVPTLPQWEKFISNIKGGNNNSYDCERNLAIVQLFMGSGIRCEELIGLDIDDLYLDDDTPYIMVMGKGKQKVQDKVLLTEDAVFCLKEYLEYRDEFIKSKIADGKEVQPKPLFLSNRGSRMSSTAIQNFFERYSEHQISPHMLRHWYGTKLYNTTHNIVLVQHQLRHKDVSTAAKYYIHVSDNDLYNAVRSLS